MPPPDDHREIRRGPLEHFADRLVAGMSDAIVYADAEGVIRLWNRGATRVFGFTETEALGRSLDIIIPEGLRERHWRGYRATMRTGQSRYGDGEILSVPALRKDGARVSVEFTIVPFTDDAGRMMGIAAILRDVTARFEELRALRKELAARRLTLTGRSRRGSDQDISNVKRARRRCFRRTPPLGILCRAAPAFCGKR